MTQARIDEGIVTHIAGTIAVGLMTTYVVAGPTAEATRTLVKTAVEVARAIVAEVARTAQTLDKDAS